MSKEIKILVVGTGTFLMRGVESYLLNLYRNIDHQKIRMDFLAPGVCKNINFFEMTKVYHDKVIEFNMSGNKFQFVKLLYSRLYLFLNQYPYDVVYINTGSVLFMAIIVLAAYRAHISIKIVHAHNGGSGIRKNIVKFLMSPIIGTLSDYYFACSKVAAKAVFPRYSLNKVILIPNGIDLFKFRFNLDERLHIREEFDLNDNYVVGHVGAFIDQKNHKFLIRVFYEAYTKNPNMRLVLIGEGPKTQEIKNMVSKLKLNQAVLFIGRSENVQGWLSAFDLFVLPSKFEGLPVSAIEAQASDLPCLLSASITTEVGISDAVEFLSIRKGIALWSKKILERAQDRRQRNISPVMKQFDEKSVAKEFESFICNLLMKEEE